MAADNESNSGKKHRVIHWNPEAGRQQSKGRWTWKRIVGWSVGGLVALLLLGRIGVEVTKLIAGPDVFRSGAGKDGSAATIDDANSAFVTQAKAEQMHELASKSLQELRRMPSDHPVQLQQMVLMEKALNEGETLLSSHDFSRAFAVFDGLNKDIDAFTKNVKAKGEARQAYDAILLRIKDLERARSLAPGKLEAAFEAAGAGRQLMNDGNFTGAKRIYDRAFAMLKEAEQALSNYVRDTLLEGQKALAGGRKEDAKRAFESALAKSPGNEAAIQGLKRAETIDRVYALLQQGDALEKQRQYAQAAEAFQKAFALDNLSALAQEGQSRAARLEKETKFAAATTAGESALKAKDWTTAIAEFESALKVYPQKKEVQTMLKTARDNAHRDAVQASLAKAYSFENTYQWQQARDAYDETMKLDSKLAEAKEGYLRTGVVIRALLKYERLIEAAEQLANKNEFQAAIRQFNEAMAVKPSYLVNSDRVQQLQKLLMSQNQPVDVTFKSDGKTYVTITAFRQLGQIQSSTIKVLPGDYEVVGRRRGYKDVVMLLQVRNGVPPPMVTVMCNASSG